MVVKTLCTCVCVGTKARGTVYVRVNEWGQGPVTRRWSHPRATERPWIRLRTGTFASENMRHKPRPASSRITLTRRRRKFVHISPTHVPDHFSNNGCDTRPTSLLVATSWHRSVNKKRRFGGRCGDFEMLWTGFVWAEAGEVRKREAQKTRLDLSAEKYRNRQKTRRGIHGLSA